MGSLVARARGVVKSYGRGRTALRILDGADLDVARGELVAVVGPSGSGKSTLLHLLGTLDRPDSGEIEVAGVRLDREPESTLTRLRRDGIGFVFQAFHLLPELSGLENVLLPARFAGDGARAAARARELLRSLGLDDVAGRLPGSLSGGEQQRIAIVRALVNDPALVLADEPTGNLDAESGQEVLRLLRSVADGGCGVVLVTHDVQASELADHVLRIESGKLVA